MIFNASSTVRPDLITDTAIYQCVRVVQYSGLIFTVRVQGWIYFF